MSMTPIKTEAWLRAMACSQQHVFPADSPAGRFLLDRRDGWYTLAGQRVQISNRPLHCSRCGTEYTVSDD